MQYIKPPTRDSYLYQSREEYRLTTQYARTLKEKQVKYWKNESKNWSRIVEGPQQYTLRTLKD